MTDKIKTKNIFIPEYISKKDIMQYSLGGLMYTPAHNVGVADAIINLKYPELRSLALCLEDAIADDTENEALAQVENTFNILDNSKSQHKFLPYIFVRVKYPSQMYKVFNKIKNPELLSGFIFPKFDITNSVEYLGILSEINRYSAHTIYGMPILESASVANATGRAERLSELKKVIDTSKDYILNIRMGGNDFCGHFGIRRGIRDTIYDIKVISDIISDIVNIFSADYVVSGVVWEYFKNEDDNSSEWADGLRNEVHKDIINGIIGKTAIHPTQLEIINTALMVSEADYRDAINILNWNDNLLAVAKGALGNRMNEKKVHVKWAEKIMIRAAVYGIS